MEAGNFKDALSLLEKALKMNKQVQGDEHPSNGAILTAMGHVHLRQKDFESAVALLFQAWELAQAGFGDNSEPVADALLELAQAHLKKKDFAKAVEFQGKALSLLQGLEGTDPDKVAGAAIALSEWLEKAEQVDGALQALKTAEQIYEYNYSVVDKRTCKVKRNVALLYLKANRYDQALEELREVEELERTLYGEGSVQLGKTFKVIGTLFIINNNPGDARDYLMRAHGIFEAKGLLRLLKEVKAKLKMLSSSSKLAAELVNVDGESGDDSGKEASPERKSSKVRAAKTKKGKSKKTVFRNNFIKEHDSNGLPQ